MFGISESLKHEINSVLIERQSIKIPIVNFDNDYGKLLQWLRANIGNQTRYNPVECKDTGGNWFIMYYSSLYCKIWIRNPNDRTLFALTWG